MSHHRSCSSLLPFPIYPLFPLSFPHRWRFQLSFHAGCAVRASGIKSNLIKPLNSEFQAVVAVTQNVRLSISIHVNGKHRTACSIWRSISASPDVRFWCCYDTLTDLRLSIYSHLYALTSALTRTRLDYLYMSRNSWRFAQVHVNSLLNILNTIQPLSVICTSTANTTHFCALKSLTYLLRRCVIIWCRPNKRTCSWERPSCNRSFAWEH